LSIGAFEKCAARLLNGSSIPPLAISLNPDSEIETADFADFTDFEGVIGHVSTHLFVAKLQGRKANFPAIAAATKSAGRSFCFAFAFASVSAVSN
jgi:hypothetical protein